MLSEYFIRRPVFATVAALVIVLLGLLAIPMLPVNQYPDLAPPSVVVTSVYVGANAETVEAAVTTPHEQELNGVAGMKYIQSFSTNDGLSQITLTFDHNRNLDQSVVEVQNRVASAEGRLPAEVRATGVTVRKSSDSFVLGVAFFSPDKRHDPKFVSNYVDRYVIDRLKRIRGVAQVNMFGDRKYAMRLWLDPQKLAARRLSVNDVVRAVQTQNVEVPAGSIGAPPLDHPQSYQMSILVEGRLSSAEEFNNLVLAQSPNGGVVRLRDVGRAELGAESYNQTIRWKRHNSVGFGITQLPDANALELARTIKAELQAIGDQLPAGMTYEVGYDPTLFIDESIHEVTKTLWEAIGFVILVIYLFLQSWRTTLIPAITIPVSLIGTFFFMKLFGFSINTLTMFGLTLATGLVVDDAIVVIENIARFAEEKKLPPLQAAIEGIREVFGAVIATSLVLIAVFVPVAFFPGTTGLMYQQFALTIAISIAISTFNALTLTPALSAMLLGQSKTKNNRFFAGVNVVLNAINDGFRHILAWAIAARGLVLAGFLALLVVTGWLFTSIPKGFVPTEDQGYFIVLGQGPEGASHDTMTRVIQKVEDILYPIADVNGMFAINGFGFTGNASNKFLAFVPLKPVSTRHGHEHSADAIINRGRMPLLSIKEAIVIPFAPPPIRGIGSTGGFQFQLQDRQGTASLGQLAGTQWELLGKMGQNPAITGAFATFTADSPTLRVKVLRDRAESLGIPMEEIFRTMQVYMGSAYINDFTYLNRIYRVYAQADGRFRDNPRGLEQLYVRANNQNMVPIRNVISVKEDSGAPVISHFNLFRSTEITGEAAPGFSTGQVADAMDLLSKQLPAGFSYEWSGLYQEQQASGNMAWMFFTLGLVFVYLVLAAQYESYLDPLIIILSVPVAVFGALVALKLRAFDNNVFTQIGLLILIGLASKNAILIVEFANQLRERGMGIAEAAFQASVIRLRPILMTSLAFIFGVLPLVFAEGAGAMARQGIGTAVFGGMIAATVLSLLVVPIQYIVVKQLAEVFWPRRERQPEHVPV
jgi:HAE1 family hydrophobic/amphiphilic exporter-1